LLKPEGKAVIIEAIWRREKIPEDVRKFWTKAFDDTLIVHTFEGHVGAFKDHGFRSCSHRNITNRNGGRLITMTVVKRLNGRKIERVIYHIRITLV